MSANLYKQNKDILSMVHFPDGTDPQTGVRHYSGESYNMQMAVLSHYLHNHNLVEKGLLAEIDMDRLAEYIHGHLTHREGYDDVDVSMVSDKPIQLELFPEFFDVPFPLPKAPRHTFIDLFAGIGGIRIPFDELGYQCTFSSEWDDKACKTYRANFGVVPFGDITKIDAGFIPKHDVLLAGFPCQAFSIMGKMQGFADTRGTMFFEIERILKHHKTPYILLENVKQLVGHDRGRTFKTILEHLSALGYHVKW
ncbi:MAG: DNA (cytosine-5-)-methyltransferase, partial [Prevotella sp.]